MFLHADHQIGDYRLEHLLGSSDFAEVYSGVHVSLKTRVAIKILNRPLTDEDIEKFHKIIQSSSLEHPHIIRVLSHGVENKKAFIVFDYAPYGSLRQRYPFGTRLPLSRVVTYVNQIASALQYAHDQGVVHQNIKPEVTAYVRSRLAKGGESE